MNDYSQFQIKVERIDVIKNTVSFKLIELQIITYYKLAFKIKFEGGKFRIIKY
jgi:hypothetical protein